MPWWSNDDDVPSPVRPLLPEAGLGILGHLIVAKLWIYSYIYDAATLLFYYWRQEKKPWEKLKEHKDPKAYVLNHNPKDGITYRSTRIMSKAHLELVEEGIDTMHKVFSYATRINGSKKCLGSRELLDEEDELQKNGKMFKKYVLGEYIWKTYNDVDRLAKGFSKGLNALGMRPMSKICIFAETRAEWLIAAVGAFKQNFTIVTLYATLGEEAIIHGLKETECEFVLTSHELMPKFKTLLDQTLSVKHLIYMEDPLKKTDTTGFREGVAIHAFCDIIDKGTYVQMDNNPPTADDVAIIMYTSGSTGIPKGVQLSHRNVAVGMMALSDVLEPVNENDVYIGYLPLAHVLELMCEAVCLVSGIPIGYSSPLTLTSKSSKIKEGCTGDAVILQPTIMVSVPFALDRIYKGIHEQISESGWFRQILFKFFYDYKLYWYYRGYETPIVDEVIFRKPRALVGGRVRILISGGAPLAPDTHEFIRNCLCVYLLQGYGLTESAASATCATRADMSTGRVGAPLRCCDIRLVDWEEGNYTVRDKPYPRGELVIGGRNIAVGYYQLPEATAQDFFEEDGRRWFRTGDIAEVHKDGEFKIIDRKKDLVKLQMGEYLSLGKLEAMLKTSSYIENICVYGDPTKQFCVALVCPGAKQLQELAKRLEKQDLTWEEMCSDLNIENEFLEKVQAHAASCKLQRFETPSAIKLCSEIWTPDMGLVTAAFKLKRKKIQEYYQSDINKMYAKAT